MEMDLELEWQDASWERMIWGLPRGSVIPAQRFFAMLGPVDEEGAREAAQLLTDREVGLDVSGLPRSGYPGAAEERLAREAELARRGGLPGALAPSDPLRLHWQDLEALPRLDGQAARELADKGAGANRLTEGLLWLVLQEALDFVGQGVLLLDLMQEGAMGLLQAMERPGADPVERGRWHVRQAMARTVALQYLSTGEAQRLVAAMRAYQQADRRLLERLGRNPGLEELAQEMGKPVTEVLALGNMVRDAMAAPKEHEEVAQSLDQVEDTAYFQLRTRVEELLSGLEDVEREILKRRFGLDGRKAMSLEETAQDLGLDPEEAEARECKAMCALRNGTY